jgi:hypothetical protein
MEINIDSQSSINITGSDIYGLDEFEDVLDLSNN